MPPSRTQRSGAGTPPTDPGRAEAGDRFVPYTRGVALVSVPALGRCTGPSVNTFAFVMPLELRNRTMAYAAQIL